MIEFYQLVLSPDTGLMRRRTVPVCAFYPTCSEYTKQAILKYGVFRGIMKGARRILRCQGRS